MVARQFPVDTQVSANEEHKRVKNKQARQKMGNYASEKIVSPDVDEFVKENRAYVVLLTDDIFRDHNNRFTPAVGTGY